MRVTDEMIYAAWNALDVALAGRLDGTEYAYGDHTPMKHALEQVFALSHAAGQDGEQCRAASDRAEVAVDLPKIRRLVGPRPMIYMNSFDGQPPCLTLNNACGVIHDLMDEVERLRALSRGVPEGKCWCLTCDPVTVRMALCPDCGNKRCPKANDHRNACTNSNEPGQPGSAYPAAIAAQRKEG